jgi:hypothetical protein
MSNGIDRRLKAAMMEFADVMILSADEIAAKLKHADEETIKNLAALTDNPQVPDEAWRGSTYPDQSFKGKRVAQWKQDAYGGRFKGRK